MAIELGKFIEDWSRSAAHERSNFQPFIYELCELLEPARPDKAGPVEQLNTYDFERIVCFRQTDVVGRRTKEDSVMMFDDFTW